MRAATLLESRGFRESTSGLAGYLTTWAGATGAVVAIRDAPEFERYLGTIDPLVAVGLVGTAGCASLHWLRSVGWLGVDRSDARSTWRHPLLGALGFGAAIIVADTVLGFPADINVTRPAAILFYPAIGFIAEVVFHVVPLTAVVAVTRWLDRARSVWTPIVLVASVETLFQVLGGGGGRHQPWLSIYLAAHMFGFGALQMTLLRRHGFGSAMLMRLAYYVIWHLVWGHARLAILF